MMILVASCTRELDPACERVREGDPVMLQIGFGTDDFLHVELGTKAEANRADESRVKDLYVLLFDENGDRFYGRYFTYEHAYAERASLLSQNAEGWYVDNSAYVGGSYTTTNGVVKIATVARQNVTLVLLANVANTVTSLDDRPTAVDRLAEIQTLSELQSVRVTLRQEVVNRSDAFLMMGTADGLDTTTMVWTETGGNPAVGVHLHTLEAKVKFCVSYNTTNIDPENTRTRNWRVSNIPTSSFLFAQGHNPGDVSYFTTEDAYFEGTEVDEEGKEWHVFSFYMLENLQQPRALIEPDGDYYMRELQEKNVDPDHAGDQYFSEYYTNGDYVYAPQRGTLVNFDVLLGLTEAGLMSILGSNQSQHALTAQTRYTIHLGDFSSSKGAVHNYDNYDVARGHAYTYYITIQNSESIFIEVKGKGAEGIREKEPAQEGTLLLATDELINCDAHYEYHSMTFTYTPELDAEHISWYVKTPFSEGGGAWDSTPAELAQQDYKWVKFGLNNVGPDGKYQTYRLQYPGDGSPELMDIHELVRFLIEQTALEKAGNPSSAFLQEDPSSPPVIRMTAFVDEFYYEKNPITSEEDPELWRRFVNAKPRELHILSDARYSQDRQSSVVTSSHSIIQHSIQTIYNIYSPSLSSLWGIEHKDEMSYAERHNKDASQIAWTWWPSGEGLPAGTTVQPKDDDNGRMNTAALWGLYTGQTQYWADDDQGHVGFLNYNVENTLPELKNDYKYLAYSCLTRNRDNNGDGIISPDELRWYTASINQLVGIWVGNESLSTTARLYQPVNANSDAPLEWRSWVISSTASESVADPNLIRAEEGATKSDFSFYDWAGFTPGNRDQVSTIRCVRNIGTFVSNGVREDVTRAPYEHMVDQYYETPAGTDPSGKVLPNEDGTYTIRFSNLNPASVRDYTEYDLPYHNENAIHDRVYLELNMQDPANAVFADGSSSTFDEETLNSDITRNGYNNYCPPGYRLPNMTELLLMAILQPDSYWSPNVNYPCRTYFTRGKLGDNLTESEKKKVGWGYNRNTGRVHLLDAGNRIHGVRCVRDRNRTGDITGKISVANADALVPGETTRVQLNFSSQGSALRNLSLALVYVTTSGVEASTEIPLTGVTLSGLTLRTEIDWEVPDVPILGNMSVRATVRNEAGVVRTFETPVKLLSGVFTSVRLLPCVYDASAQNPPFPVAVTVSSASMPIEQVSLCISDPDGDIRRVALPVGAGEEHFLSAVYNFEYQLRSLQTGVYEFLVEAVVRKNENDVAVRSASASMEILKVNYWPNPLPEAPLVWNTSADITGLWDKQEVKNMRFSAGDFIEANMDIANCTYHEVMQENNPSQRDNNLTIGRDNLISIGVNDTDYATDDIKVPYVFHVFYPAHDDSASSGKDWLRLNPSTPAGRSNGCNYKWFRGGEGTGFTLYSGALYKPTLTDLQHFRFSGEGIFWNDQKVDFDHSGVEWNKANAKASYNTILQASTVFVGSTQGLHHSRAGYMFVRAVHNSSSENAAGGGVNFGNNPVNGGAL